MATANSHEYLYRECFVYVLDLIRFSEILENNNKNSIAQQLLKLATDFGVYINEAKYTDKIDIINENLKKSIETARKIKYLLLLCKYSGTYPNPNQLISDIEKLIENISLNINN